MTLPRPSDLEMQVLAVLWDNGPMTVRQLLEAMPDRKKRAYTTILSVLQGMEKKGLVGHDRDGVTHVYKPAVRRQQIMKPFLRDLLQNVFGGNKSTALQYLLDSSPVAEDDLAEIKRLIEEHELKNKRKGERS